VVFRSFVSFFAQILGSENGLSLQTLVSFFVVIVKRVYMDIIGSGRIIAVV